MTYLSSSIFRYLCAIFALWVVLFYNSIESTVAIWYRSETFAHCFIILPICIYLISLKWNKLHNVRLQPSLLSLVFILGTLFVWLFGNLAQVLVIEQYATFAMLPLMIWCVLGNQVARLLLFCSLFWLFSVPAGEFLIPQLQELTADITVWAIQVTGIPVFREGLYIAIPGGLFEVAVACSGIRYLIASFTLGTLFAYLNYNRLSKRLIFIAFSIVLPLIANGIRAYGIVMIAHLSDMQYATGVDHLIYGWVFFGVVILIMFTVGGRWADPLPEKTPMSNPAGPKLDLRSLSKPLIGLVLIIGIAITYKQIFEHPVSPINPDLAATLEIERPLNNPTWLPKFINPSSQETGTDGEFDFYSAYYNGNLQGRELINGANKLYNIEFWSIISEDVNQQFRTLKIIDNYGNKRVMTYTYVTPWLVSPKALQVKLVQAIQAVLGQPQNGFVVVISKSIEKDDNDQQLVEQKMRDLLQGNVQQLLTE